jgi:hypothetical protein
MSEPVQDQVDRLGLGLQRVLATEQGGQVHGRP